MAAAEARPLRPTSRRDIEVAVICALSREADAVQALFDVDWDDEGLSLEKAPGDSNAYSIGAIGRHNVVLVHMPSTGKVSASASASNCRMSFPNIKLGLVVGICGVVPFDETGSELVLGDVVISDGVIQYDLGWQTNAGFARKDTLLDSLGRPNSEIRAVLAKLRALRHRKRLMGKIETYLKHLQKEEPLLAAGYPGAIKDKLFEAEYPHAGDKNRNVARSCDEVCADERLVPRSRLQSGESSLLLPHVHFGLIASGDSVIRSAKKRDEVAGTSHILAFEMEGAGVWDSFPCVVIKGACDYADSHKNKLWQHYAAATAAACMKAFLSHWVPSFDAGPRRPEPVFFVPYPENKAFIGREDVMTKLREQFFELSASRVALSGLGGIGKTQIALAYCYWFHTEHPEVSIFWVHGGTADRCRQSYAAIAEECSIPGYDNPHADVLQLVKSWLERMNSHPWLMVVDNADDKQVFYSPQSDENASLSPGRSFAHFIPECRHGLVLITTRNVQAGIMLAKGGAMINVDAFGETDSGLLVSSCLQGVQATAEEISLLSSKLDYLPLALVQATAYIRINAIKVAQYTKLLDESEQTTVEMLRQEFDTIGRDSGTPHSVAATWMISFRQIERQNELAGKFLSILGFFDRQAIPFEFLEDYNKRLRPSPPRQGHEVRGHIDRGFVDALGDLKGFSFITSFDTPGGHENLVIHRLVQLVTRRWLFNKGKFGHYAGEALETLGNLFPKGGYETRTTCETYSPHLSILQYTDKAFEYLNSEGNVPKSSAVVRAVLDLLYNSANYFLYRGAWEEAEINLTHAISMAKEALGEDALDTLTLTELLAKVYETRGRFDEAESLRVRALETRIRTEGEESSSLQTAMANLAFHHQRRGRFAEAESLVSKLVEINEKAHGADHPNTLSYLRKLAIVQWNQNKDAAVESRLRKLLEDTRRIQGPEHTDTLSVMDSLASILEDQGQMAEAEALMAELIEVRKTVLGEEHPATLQAMNHLAIVLTKQHRPAEAAILAEKVMELRKGVQKEEHGDVLNTLKVLVMVYHEQNNFEQAESFAKRVIEISVRLRGEEDFETMQTKDILILTYVTQGKSSEAESLLTELLKSRERIYGEYHDETVGDRQLLLNLYAKVGRWVDAEPHWVRQAEAYRRNKGGQPESLMISRTLINFYEHEKMWDKAALQLKKLVDDLEKSKGEEHVETLAALEKLASAHIKQQHWAEAEVPMKKLLTVVRRVRGDTDQYTLSCLSQLVVVSRQAGHLDKAVELMRERVRIDGQISGLRGILLAMASRAILAGFERELLEQSTPNVD